MDIPASVTIPKSDSAKTSAASQVRHLWGPWIDFLLLGGASLIVVPVVLLLPAYGIGTVQLLAFTLVLANFINHPHFASSYQIFYRRFLEKCRSDAQPADWRVRYLIAGVLVPCVLLGYFSTALVSNNWLLLGWSVNAMGLLVGWHYAKQAYGILMLDSVNKRQFFKEPEKSLLRFNGYACWLLSWVLANQIIKEHDYFGIAYYSFSTPAAIRYALIAGCAVSTTLVLRLFIRRLKLGWGLSPINGFAAYFISLYLWLLVREPMLLLVYPALHSMQYLAVTTRYQTNLADADIQAGADRKRSPQLLLAFRLVLAFAGGYLGFWLLPDLLTQGFSPKGPLQTSIAPFFLACWVAINIHHYFMDNVIWRKGNPDTGRYLHSRPPAT